MKSSQTDWRLWAILIVGLAAALIGFFLTRTISGPSAGEPGGKTGPTFTGGPRLAISQSVVDFGQVAYNQRVEPTWTLTNVGDAPLHIQDLKLKVEAG